MIEFVIYDDNKLFCEKTKQAVKKVMDNCSNDYLIKVYNSYNKDFDETIKNEMTSRVYILDIEVENSASGIDIARKIRKKDWNSIIIMVTSHVELGYEALKAQIMLLDFICKQNDCMKNLVLALRKAINKISDKKVLVFEQSGMISRVYTDDIIYILRDNVERKCIVRTTYGSISVNKNLKDFMEELDDRFFLTHRSCLVNTKKVLSIDWKNSTIRFDNNETIDYLSRERKKEFKEHVKAF